MRFSLLMTCLLSPLTTICSPCFGTTRATSLSILFLVSTTDAQTNFCTHCILFSLLSYFVNSTLKTPNAIGHNCSDFSRYYTSLFTGKRLDLLIPLSPWFYGNRTTIAHFRVCLVLLVLKRKGTIAQNHLSCILYSIESCMLTVIRLSGF
jgi:hypothetical protein